MKTIIDAVLSQAQADGEITTTAARRIAKNLGKRPSSGDRSLQTLLARGDLRRVVPGKYVPRSPA